MVDDEPTDLVDEAAPTIIEPDPADVPIAERAVIVHRREQWPDHPRCHNCHARWPCPINQWGMTILRAAGITSEEVAEMLRAAQHGTIPWANTPHQWRHPK
jgi:hypothetical protein